jgi:hypothetical protein
MERLQSCHVPLEPFVGIIGTSGPSIRRAGQRVSYRRFYIDPPGAIYDGKSMSRLWHDLLVRKIRASDTCGQESKRLRQESTPQLGATF